MAEFPVTCSCGTEFIANDEGGGEIQCPTCGNVLHLEREPAASASPATTSYFRCPRCERPILLRWKLCPYCGSSTGASILPAPAPAHASGEASGED